MAKKLKTAEKAGKGTPLHQWVATGKSPKDFDGTKGLNANTVPGYKGRARGRTY